jgi:hypothetical protein
MSYSRRELYAMGEPLGECVTRKEGGRIIYGGGGGGGPTSTTVTQSNVPDWLRPQVENVLLGAGKQLFQTVPDTSRPITDADGKPVLGADGKPTYESSITGTKAFTPYSSDPSKYVAGFSPLQQQVQQNAANLRMPTQYGQATGLAQQAGLGGMQSAQQALGYGNAGFQSGQMGQNLGIQGGQYYGGMGAGYGQQGAQLGLDAAQRAAQQAGLAQAQAYGYGNAGFQYGNTAADIGQMALQAQQYGSKIGSQAEQYAKQAAGAGKDYGYLMQSPALMKNYMSPYQQNVIDIQNQAAQRNADIAAQSRKASAARAGAFGGSRQAIENAEANRALQSQMNANQATGLQSAYDRAQQAIQAGMGYELQGVGAANQSLGTALQGGQLGLSGIGQAIAGQQAGMQGAGVGLSGVGQALGAGQLGLQGAGVGLQGTGQGMQGAQIGLQGVDRQLAGTAQGMQGAQVGLQGVSGAQAGYGLANQSANTLGNLGNQQLAAQQGILGFQNQIGSQQQAQQQQIINQAIQNYANAQNAPMDALTQYNALLRGYAVPGQTATQYQAAPNIASQIGGLGMTGVAGLGLYNAMNK